jgi:hypothetical protein
MIISPRKREQLATFLASLPEAAARKLFAALEADRAAGRGDLPHADLLDPLRARLLQTAIGLPERRRDAKRVFFSPMEDFFVGAHGEKKRPAQIARTSLDPIWRLLMSHGATRDASLAAASLDDALARAPAGANKNSGEDEKALTRALFIAAEAGLARLCEEAEADSRARKNIVATLGGDAAFGDTGEIRQLLKGVDYFDRLKALFPSPSPPLTEEKLFEFRRLFLSVHDQSRAIGGYLLLALKGRLEQPWRALGVYYNLIDLADEGPEDAKEAVAALAESLFEDLEVLARGLERAGEGAFDPDAARARAAYFADFADGLAQQSKRAGDKVFFNRVAANRDVAAEAFDRFMEQAFAALRQAMPVRAAGGSSRLMTRRPDFSAPLSRGVLETAAAAAAFIAAAPAVARRLDADPAAAGAVIGDAQDGLRAFAKDLIVEIRAAEGDARKAARRMFAHILAIAAPLLDPDEVGLLRDREAAAGVAV